MPHVDMPLPQLQGRARLYEDPEGRLLGFAELVIGGAFVIKDIRILKGRADGPGREAFLSFPSRRRKGDEQTYYDVAHPITGDAYRAAVEAVLKAYGAARAGRAS